MINLDRLITAGFLAITYKCCFSWNNDHYRCIQIFRNKVSWERAHRVIQALKLKKEERDLNSVEAHLGWREGWTLCLLRSIDHTCACLMVGINLVSGFEQPSHIRSGSRSHRLRCSGGCRSRELLFALLKEPKLKGQRIIIIWLLFLYQHSLLIELSNWKLAN